MESGKMGVGWEMVRCMGCGGGDPSGASRHLPLRRGGFGVRIATASVRTGFAMTPFARGAVKIRRAGRGVRPYGMLQGGGAGAAGHMGPALHYYKY